MNPERWSRQVRQCRPLNRKTKQDQQNLGTKYRNVIQYLDITIYNHHWHEINDLSLYIYIVPHITIYIVPNNFFIPFFGGTASKEVLHHTPSQPPRGPASVWCVLFLLCFLEAQLIKQKVVRVNSYENCKTIITQITILSLILSFFFWTLQEFSWGKKGVFF